MIIRQFLGQHENASYLNISFLIIIFWFLDKEYENFKTETQVRAGGGKLIGLYILMTLYAFIMVNYVIFSFGGNELYHLGFDIWSNSFVMTFIILILFLRSDAKETLRKSNLMILIWLIVNVFIHLVYNIYTGNPIRLTIDAVLLMTRFTAFAAFYYRDTPKSGKVQFCLIGLNVPLDIYLLITSVDVRNSVIDGFIVSIHLLYLWILQKQYQIFCKTETRLSSATTPRHQGALTEDELEEAIDDRRIFPILVTQLVVSYVQDPMPAFDCIWVMYGLTIIDFIADFFARVIFENQDIGLKLDISFLLVIFWFLDKEYESFRSMTRTSSYWRQQLGIYSLLAIYTFVMVNYIIFSVLAGGDFSLLQFNFWDNAVVMTGILYIIFWRCKEDHELRRCNDTILLWLFVNGALCLGYYLYLGTQSEVSICGAFLVTRMLMFVGNQMDYKIDHEKEIPLAENVQALGLLFNLVWEPVLFWNNIVDNNYRSLVIDASLWVIQLLYLYIFHYRTNYLRKFGRRMCNCVTEFGRTIRRHPKGYQPLLEC